MGVPRCLRRAAGRNEAEDSSEDQLLEDPDELPVQRPQSVVPEELPDGLRRLRLIAELFLQGVNGHLAPQAQQGATVVSVCSTGLKQLHQCPCEHPATIGDATCRELDILPAPG